MPDGHTGDEDIVLGCGKFGACKLKSYRGMLVAVKEFFEPCSPGTVLGEANILSDLKHIGIPILFGVSVAEKPYCLITQFYGIGNMSVTVDYALRQNGEISFSSFSDSNCWHFLLELSDTLCYVHTKGYLHNDLKTDNVLIVKESTARPSDYQFGPVLIDFGKASTISNGQMSYL